MPSSSSLLRLTTSLLLSALAAPAYAQQYAATPPLPAYAPAPSPAGGPASAEMFSNLSDEPSTHSGFVFDRSMVQIAQSVLIDNGVDAKRAAAAITGIAIDNYHFKTPAFYIPEAMAQLSATYKAAGWSHLVDQSNRTPASSAAPSLAASRTAFTDLWLHHHGTDIDAVTVLRRGPREMYVLQLTGDLRPLDLLHISGHFGIPKVDPGTVMVPAP